MSFRRGEVPSPDEKRQKEINKAAIIFSSGREHCETFLRLLKFAQYISGNYLKNGGLPKYSRHARGF